MLRVGALVLFLAFSSSAPQRERLTQYVDPFMGTGGRGHTYPGPSLPFGMIQPGPDTRLDGWDGVSGYHYSDSRINGFTHTHLSGTGIHDYTDVLLMPGTGQVRFSNGADGKPGSGSSFSHDEEIARAGYYAVTLRDSGIRAELTTTQRVGLHRYTLPQGQPAGASSSKRPTMDRTSGRSGWRRTWWRRATGGQRSGTQCESCCARARAVSENPRGHVRASAGGIQALARRPGFSPMRSL